MTWQMMDANNAVQTQTITMTGGVTDRDTVSGSIDFYTTIFPTETAPSASSGILGTWNMVDTAGTASSAITNGIYSLIRYVSATPTLDPDAWGPIRSANRFPLNFSVTFYDGNGNPINTTPVRMSVLADGNIVSDLHNECASTLNPDTLLNADGTQEFPLGVVENAYNGSQNDNSGGGTWMTVMFAISNAAAAAYGQPNLSYAQTLTSMALPTTDSTTQTVSGELLLRVDAGAGNMYLHLTDGNYTDGAGGWGIAWATNRAIGLSDSNLLAQSSGLMSSVPTSGCN
jgi:hypothetical protein